MVPDWNDPFQILSPYGTLDLNDPLGADGYFLLNKDACSVGPVVRAQVDDIPMGDGSITHRRFLTGTRMKLAVQLWQAEDDAACGAALTTMYDTLMLHVRGLLRSGDNEGRVLWTPSGANTRMLDDVNLLEYPEMDVLDNLVTQITFSVDTVFPYAIDLTEQIDTVSPGGSTVVTNAGNAEVWPVLIVSGDADVFTISNTTLGLSFLYNRFLPGAVLIAAPNTGEIDTFRNTMYLNGSGANLKPGIDVLNSDFFPLGPGDNTITLSTGAADLQVVWNNAWA